MLKKLKLIFNFAKTELQTNAQYRLGVVSMVISGVVTPLIMMSIWLIVGANTKLALTSSQIVSYYLLNILVGRVTQAWSIEHIGQQIRKGEFGSKLLKPYFYLTEEWGITFGRKASRLITLIPIIALMAIILHSHLRYDLSPGNVVLFIAALVLGNVVQFYLMNTFVSFVFWLEEYHSLQFLHDLFVEGFSGALVPLILLPVFLRTVTTYSPFRYYFSFPTEIALGILSGQEVLLGFLIGLAYFLAFFILRKVAFKVAIKHFSAYGN